MTRLLGRNTGTPALVRAACTACLLTVPLAASAQEVDECFDLSLGAWSFEEGSHTLDSEPPSPPEISADSISASTPSRIGLTDLPSRRRRPNLGRIVVPSGTLDTPHAFKKWERKGDTLSISFSTGYSGTRSHLLPDGDRWTGQIETFSDQIGYGRHRASIELRPVDCDAPPSVPASVDPPLLRTIQLVGGDSLALGVRISDRLWLLPRRTGAWTVLATAEGLWAGHDTIVIRLDDERTVHHIELRYPRGFDITPLADSLRRRYLRGRWSDTIARWANRTTRMHLGLGSRPRFFTLDRRYF